MMRILSCITLIIEEYRTYQMHLLAVIGQKSAILSDFREIIQYISAWKLLSKIHLTVISYYKVRVFVFNENQHLYLIQKRKAWCKRLTGTHTLVYSWSSYHCHPVQYKRSARMLLYPGCSNICLSYHIHLLPVEVGHKLQINIYVINM